MQHAVDPRAGPSGRGLFDLGHVCVHHHEFRAGVRFDEADAFIVIAMGVADQDNLRVRVLEAEPLDALSDSGHILFEVPVDEDVALRSGDQIRREVGCSDVIQVAGDPEAGNAAVPVGVRLRA